MKRVEPSRRAGCLLVFLTLVGVVRVASSADAGVPDYRLHAGDKVHVSVWKEDELRRDLIISPDGKLFFPLVGDIVAIGKTVGQVRGEIETKLRKYHQEPVVTVLIEQVNGNVAYVIGQVQKPGAL